MVKVRELFRDTDSTEFVIVTIPTVIIFRFFFVIITNYALLIDWCIEFEFE